MTWSWTPDCLVLSVVCVIEKLWHDFGRRSVEIEVRFNRQRMADIDAGQLPRRIYGYDVRYPEEPVAFDLLDMGPRWEATVKALVPAGEWTHVVTGDNL